MIGKNQTSAKRQLLTSPAIGTHEWDRFNQARTEQPNKKCHPSTCRMGVVTGADYVITATPAYDLPVLMVVGSKVHVSLRGL